ncbi:hypothetical protein ACOSQ4_024537 [Xanthoceras sorbifolium]
MHYLPSVPPTFGESSHKLPLKFNKTGYTISSESAYPRSGLFYKGQGEYFALQCIESFLHIHPIEVGIQIIVWVASSIVSTPVFAGYLYMIRYIPRRIFPL